MNSSPVGTDKKAFHDDKSPLYHQITHKLFQTVVNAGYFCSIHYSFIKLKYCIKEWTITNKHVKNSIDIQGKTITADALLTQ